MAQQPQREDFGYGEQFEPDVFWEKHGQKIMLGALGVIVIGVVLYFWQASIHSAREEMATRLYEAKSPADLEAIIRDYTQKPAAANAMIKLGNMHFSEGRYDDAAQTYRQFAQRFPQHLLSVSARFGLAAAEEARGQFDAAKQLYQDVILKHPDHPLATAARVAVARCTEALGQKDDAIKLYQEAIAVMRDIKPLPRFWWDEASSRVTILTRDQPKQLPVPAKAAAEPLTSEEPKTQGSAPSPEPAK